MAGASEMTDPVAGGCLCGAVRYTIAVEPINVRICHCHICQKATGSAFFARAMFPRAGIRISGETRGYASSDDLTRHFCPICGTHVFADRKSNPAAISVTLGTLDDPGAFPPQVQIWTASKMPWLALDEDLPHFTAGPP